MTLMPLASFLDTFRKTGRSCQKRIFWWIGDLQKDYEVKYLCWKRHNITELKEAFERNKALYNNFEKFCRNAFDGI